MSLRCHILHEGAALKPTVRRMRLHFFAVVVPVEPSVALVVLGMVLVRSTYMYPVLDVCVYCDDVRLYWNVVDRCFIYKTGRKLFSIKSKGP